MYLDVSLPVAVCHATGIDGGEANVPEAKDGVYERMYLYVSLPVAVRHATCIVRCSDFEFFSHFSRC